MSCGKSDEEILSRVVEGNEEIVTVRKICHHNPVEDFETIQVRRKPISQPEPKVKEEKVVEEPTVKIVEFKRKESFWVRLKKFILRLIKR